MLYKKFSLTNQQSSSYVVTTVENRDVKASRPVWPRVEAILFGLGLGLVVSGLGLGLMHCGLGLEKNFRPRPRPRPNFLWPRANLASTQLNSTQQVITDAGVKHLYVRMNVSSNISD